MPDAGSRPEPVLGGRVSPPQPTARAGAPPTTRFRIHLLRLVLAIALPLILLAAGLVVWSAERERARALEGVAATARAMQLALDREIGLTVAALQALATSPALDAALAAGPAGAGAAPFHAQASTLVERRPSALFNVSLVAPGEPPVQVVNTLVPPGERPPTLGEVRYPPRPLGAPPPPGFAFREVMAGGRLYVTDLFRGLAARWTVVVALPVLRDGAVVGVLSAGLRPASLGEVLRQHLPPTGGVAALADRGGVVVARTAEAERFVGGAAGPGVLAFQQDPAAEAASGRGTSLDGTPLYAAYRRLGVTPFAVAYGPPRAAVDAPVRRALALAGGGGALALALAAALALWLGRRLGREGAALGADAAALARGEVPPPRPPSPVREVETARAEFLRSTAALAESEARLRLAGEAGGVGLFERDLRTGRAHWSPTLFRLYGLDPAGRRSPEVEEGEYLALVHPEDRERQAAERAALRADPAVRRFEIEFRIRRADTGEVRWVSSRGEFDRDPAGAAAVVRGVQQDVTERRRAQDALAEGEARFRAMVQVAPQVVWTADAEGRLTFASAVWWDTTGQDPAAVLGGHAWLGAVHPEDAGSMSAAWEAAQAEARAGGPGRFEAEFRLRRAADGAHRWFFSRGVPERDATGRVLRWIGAAFDVHERRVAEAALAASEVRLRSIVETAADGILVAAADGRILSANPAALRLFGYEGDAPALLGRSLAVLMPDADAARHDAFLAAHRATGEARAIGVPGRGLMGRRRDGGEFPIDLSVGSFEVGGERFFTGVVRDVTRRRRTEAALAESEARLARAVAAARIGTWEWDAVADRLTGSPGREALYGRPPGALPDRAALLAAVHPEDRAAVAGAAERALRGEAGGIYEAEYRTVWPDGAVRWLRTQGRAEFGPDGAPLRMSGAVVDVTERREAGERQTLLAREVDHRAKNALAVALSVVRLAPRDVPPAEFARAVEGRIAAMARAHSLLAAGRWTGAELRAVAAGELAAYADRVRIEGAPVRLAPEAAQPVAMLLHELATNAAKHGALSAPEGRVELGWEPWPEAMGGGLRLRWAERGGPPVAGPPARTGFGHRLVSLLAERQLGGAAAFDWSNPAGLRVGITLPARHVRVTPGAEEAAARLGARPSGEPPPPPLVPPGARPPPRVLVVEDQALLALEAEAVLGALGCEVVGPARTLTEALRLATAEPDLGAAVLDVNLGEGDRVFPVVDVLRTRGVPYLFATGYASAVLAADQEAGAVAVLRKPYAREAVAGALLRALARQEGG